MTTTTTRPISTGVDAFVHDLLPYRYRAAELTSAVVALQPDALDEIKAFLAELDERFVKPLTAAYEAIPPAQRASCPRGDVDQHDAIWQLVTAFAGAWELATLHGIAAGETEPAGWPDATIRDLEVELAALRYRERFGDGS